MKIFLSYGHNDHAALVNRVFDALRREGHTPWKDDRYEGSSGIKAGEDFTKKIYQTILDSDFVIAFVTAVTQERQYCIEERQYAYNHKGTHFIQIRLDDVDITLGNSRSYIDMGDVEGTRGEINVPLFEEKMKSLWAALRDPESFAQGGLAYWAKFEAHLRVKGTTELIGTLAPEDFVGREWLTRRCREWATDASVPCRLFTILGEAGTGKSAFVRHLAADRELVRSVHVCIYDRPSTRKIRDTLKDLAFILAKNSDSYYNFLKDRDLACIRDMEFDGIFEYLFLEPLKNETQKLMLIIDGLDEMEEDNGFVPLMKLFRQYAGELNPNISFLVTARPDAYILSKLDTVPNAGESQRVLLDGAVSREDLWRYIHGKLEALGKPSRELEERLLTACDGNFEYLALFFREIREGNRELAEDAAIPRGLYGRYAQYLDRRMEMSGRACRLDRLQRWLLELLTDVMEPVPLELLGALLEEDPEELRQELDVFGSLIRQQYSGEELLVSLFTKGFRDFLGEKNVSAYRVSRGKGSDAIACYVLEKCKKERRLKAVPYLDRWGWVHLLNYANREPEEAAEYLRARLEEDREATANRIARSLVSGDRETVRGYAAIFRELNAGRWVNRCLKAHREKQTMEALAAELEEAGFPAEGWLLAADAARLDPTPQVLAWAEETYRKVLTYLEEKSEGDSGGLLIPVYDRLGNLEKGKNTPEGDAAASEWYRRVLVLDEENYRQNPGYESRHSLAITYDSLGSLEKRKNTPEGHAAAADWYRRELVLAEENYRQNPGYESRRSLAVTYDRLGYLEARKNSFEGDVAAAEWYCRELELAEENYRQNPGCESRRSLGVIYKNLAILERRKHTPEGDAAAKVWEEKARALLEA